MAISWQVPAGLSFGHSVSLVAIKFECSLCLVEMLRECFLRREPITNLHFAFGVYGGHVVFSEVQSTA